MELIWNHCLTQASMKIFKTSFATIKHHLNPSLISVFHTKNIVPPSKIAHYCNESSKRLIPSVEKIKNNNHQFKRARGEPIAIPSITSACKKRNNVPSVREGITEKPTVPSNILMGNLMMVRN